MNYDCQSHGHAIRNRDGVCTGVNFDNLREDPILYIIGGTGIVFLPRELVGRGASELEIITYLADFCDYLNSRAFSADA